jgi:excisionase family DNA binding protein
MYNHDQLNSMRQAAERIGVSYSMIKHMAATGEIRTVKIGRRRLVAESVLQRYIADKLEEVDAA